jgi:hypothetical protein
MNFAAAERIAAAVLYEGYILYPYRATSTKNLQRWNFGTLYPQEYAEVQRPAETFRLLAECLVSADAHTQLDLRVRFLQLVRRRENTPQEWEEGIERAVELNSLVPAGLASQPFRHRFSFPATDTVTNHVADFPTPQNLAGHLEIRVHSVRDGVLRLSLEVANTTSMENAAQVDRKDAMLEAFVSAHVLLGVEAGEFVSMLDPPEEWKEAVGACQNVGVFPVLVGEEGQRSMLLCSPIILYDYPQIAPESAGDFFDGTEMDEMLALRVMTLTNEEKQEMRKVDDRARRILERTETLPQDFLMKVHGAIRSMHPTKDSPPVAHPDVDATTIGGWNPWTVTSAPESVRVFGCELKVGSRVRLWPQKKADIMDMALEGKVGVVEAIEQDFEDNVQLAVVLDDDPGREFGMMRQPGHRFFFSVEEVEPLEDAELKEHA